MWLTEPFVCSNTGVTDSSMLLAVLDCLRQKTQAHERMKAQPASHLATRAMLKPQNGHGGSTDGRQTLQSCTRPLQCWFIMSWTDDGFDSHRDLVHKQRNSVEPTGDRRSVLGSCSSQPQQLNALLHRC